MRLALVAVLLLAGCSGHAPSRCVSPAVGQRAAPVAPRTERPFAYVPNTDDDGNCPGGVCRPRGYFSGGSK